MPFLSLTPPLTLATLAALLRSDEPTRLDPADEPRLAADYTGAPAELTLPTAHLLLAHAVGTGPELPAPLVRRLLLLQAYRLGLAQPGVNPALLRRLLDFFNREVWPVVPKQGAVGAEYNQIPLAHLALPLLGLGEVNYQGYRLAAADVLSLFSWEPLALRSQEDHALLRGGAFTLAYATEALARATHLLAAAEAIGALAADVYGVGPAPDSALLAGSELPVQPWAASAEPTAAAFGSLASVTAARHALAQSSHAVETVLNAAATPTPVFSTEKSAAASLLLAPLTQAVAAVGELAAQRVARLVAGERQLPRYLAPDLAVGFGLLALPPLAASLVAQNEQLSEATASSTPAANTAGAAELLRLIEHTEQLLGIELLAAVQALDLRRPARSSAALEAVAVAFRAVVTFVTHDRVLAPDLHRAARFVREYAWS
ncbi:MAG: aromatic amino acid lyase [Janthinobacterium lividum]